MDSNQTGKKGVNGMTHVDDIFVSNVTGTCVKIIIIILVAAVISYFAKCWFGPVYQSISFVVLSLLGILPIIAYYDRKIKQQSSRIIELQDHMIRTMADVIEERDASTGGHINRTANLVKVLLDAMSKDGRYSYLTQAYIDRVTSAAPLHDVGKIKIPDNIINKPGKLTPVEYEVMKKHSEYGADLVHRCIKNVEDKSYFKVAYNIALFHHERYDGKGYPTGLIGDQIPLEARIMALADVYDALVSPRVYKSPFPKAKAIAILIEGRGTQFDPDLTDIFISCLEKNEHL